MNDGERYMPALFGNDKAECPLVFNLCYLSVKDQDEIEYYEAIQVKGVDRMRLKVNFNEVFLRGVESIDGCREYGKDKMTPAEFLAIRGKASRRLYAIVQDVAQRIKQAGEIDEKNSEQPSAFGSGATSTSTGA